MVVHLNQASGGTSATAGRSVRAVLYQASTNDTEVKVEVYMELGIDEFKGDDHGEEEQDGSMEYDIGGVFEDDEENSVLHVGLLSHVQAMKEKLAHAVRDFVQYERGKKDDDKLRLGVGELKSAIFRTPKRIYTSRQTGSIIELL